MPMGASLVCTSLGATLPHLGLHARRTSARRALIAGYARPRISSGRLPGRGLAALARRGCTPRILAQAAPSSPKGESQQEMQPTDAPPNSVTVVFEVPCRLGPGESLAIAGEIHELGGSDECGALRLGWGPGDTPSADKWRSASVKLNPGTLEFWVVKLLCNGEADWGSKRAVVLPTLSPLMARCGCLKVIAHLGDASATGMQLVLEDKSQAQSLISDASSRAQELSRRQVALQARVLALEEQVQESEGKLRHVRSLLQRRRKDAAAAAGAVAGAAPPGPPLDLPGEGLGQAAQLRPLPRAALQPLSMERGPANSAVPSPGLAAPAAPAAAAAAVPAAVSAMATAAVPAAASAGKSPTTMAAAAAALEPRGGEEWLGVVRSCWESSALEEFWEGRRVQCSGGGIEGPTGRMATAQRSTAGSMALEGAATGADPRVQLQMQPIEEAEGAATAEHCTGCAGDGSVDVEVGGSRGAAAAAALEAAATKVRAQLQYAGGMLERTLDGDGSIMYRFREGGCLASQLAEVYCPNFLPRAAVAALQRCSFVICPSPHPGDEEGEGVEGEGATVEEEGIELHSCCTSAPSPPHLPQDGVFVGVEEGELQASHGGVLAAAGAYTDEEEEWEGLHAYASNDSELAAAATMVSEAEEEDREWEAAAAEVRARLQAAGGLASLEARRDGSLVYRFREGGCPSSQLSEAYCAPFLPPAAAAALQRRGFLTLSAQLPESSTPLESPLEGAVLGGSDASPVEGPVGVPICGPGKRSGVVQVAQLAGAGSKMGVSCSGHAQGRAHRLGQGLVESKPGRVDISSPSFPGLLMVAAAQQAWEAWRLLGLQARSVGARVYARFAAARAQQRADC